MARPEAAREPARGGSAWRLLAATGAAVLVAASWLLAPVHAPRRPAPLRVVLVDASASVTRLRPGWQAWARGLLGEEARVAGERGEELLALLYARDVVVLAGPGRVVPGELDRAGLEVSRDGALASDLSAALDVADRLVGGRPLAALRLLSDRGFTGRDPEPALRRLEAGGAERAWLEPPPVALPDLALTRLDLPDEVEPGAPLGARAWLAARAPPGSAALAYALEVVLEGPSGARRWSVEGSVDPDRRDPTALALDLGTAQPGTTRVALRVLLAGALARGDAVPENDRAGGTVHAGDELRIVVRSGAEAAAAASSWTRRLDTRPGLDARMVDAEGLGVELGQADLLVTYDADLGALPYEALTSFVHRGGGWLALTGVESVGTWELAEGLDALAPLEPHAGDRAERDVVIVLDASGSMAGAPADEARRAARALAAAAAEGERVVLRWFTDRLEREIEVASDPGALLASREPGGGTDVPAALAALAEQYVATPERKALALLVTDGRDQQADDDALEALRGRLRESGVELAVFAVGEQADLAFLRRLVGAQGRLRLAAQASQLVALLEREAAGSRLRVQGPYQASFASGASGALARDAASPQALGGDRLPELEGYVRMRAHPDAVVAWVALEGEPLLGVARRGLGATALFSSLPGPAASGWAPAWEAALLEPLVRWLGRGRPVQRPRLFLEAGVLTVEDTPAEWPAEVLARSGSHEARLGPAPGALGDPGERRCGPWPWSATQASEITLAAPDHGPLATLFLAPGTPEELAWQPRRVAAGAEGTADPLAPSARGAARSNRSGHPSGPWALGLGLLLVAGAGLAWGRR